MLIKSAFFKDYRRKKGFFMITTITKRDGRKAHFDLNKIANAIQKAFRDTAEEND